MGLNDSYASIHSQIIAMDHLPNVGKIYSIIHQEEKQRLLHLPLSNTFDKVAMAANLTLPIFILMSLRDEALAAKL